MTSKTLCISSDIKRSKRPGSRYPIDNIVTKKNRPSYSSNSINLIENLSFDPSEEYSQSARTRMYENSQDSLLSFNLSNDSIESIQESQEIIDEDGIVSVSENFRSNETISFSQAMILEADKLNTSKSYFVPETPDDSNEPKTEIDDAIDAQKIKIEELKKQILIEEQNTILLRKIKTVYRWTQEYYDKEKNKNIEHSKIQCEKFIANLLVWRELMSKCSRDNFNLNLLTFLDLKTEMIENFGRELDKQMYEQMKKLSNLITGSMINKFNCSICCSDNVNMFINKCGHVYCQTCDEKNKKKICFVCRSKIKDLRRIFIA